VYLKEARYKKQRNRVGDHSWMSMVDILPSYETIPGDSLEVESSSRGEGYSYYRYAFTTLKSK
jgi:hypothetical protein